MNYPKPIIMISACIEHAAVRFDGTMISDEVIRSLKDVVNFIAICPEVSIGMPSPREAIRLVQRDGEDIKLLTSTTNIDYTDKMQTFTNYYIKKLKTYDVDGFILKAKSPSCGLQNVKIYRDTGKAHTRSANNAGMFGGKLHKRFSNYPIETERRLSNFTIRENFFISVFTLARFKEIKKLNKAKHLVDFHAKNKYLFMSYNQNNVRTLGRIVANHNKLPIEEVLNNYHQELQLLLHKEPTKKKRVNTLTHIYGYFKDKLSKAEKDYYFETQDDYINNHIPFSNVLSILKGYSVRFNEEYLLQQTVFEPYPKSLLLQLDSGKKL